MADRPRSSTVVGPGPQRAAPRRLDWAAKSRGTMLDAEKYSRFVSIMKRALPMAAVVLIAAVVAYALQPRQQDRVTMTFESMREVDNDLAMIKPRLIGDDSDGNPFVVTADRAVQVGRNSRRARLENVEADMTIAKKDWLNATAARGLFDMDSNMLTLDGGLSVFSDTGYELHTQSATVDLKKSIVRGRNTVSGQGPIGTMRADTFVLDRAGGTLVLNGHVHTTIDTNGSIK
jgi:lipopolysaccharide export system protein LptC